MKNIKATIQDMMKHPAIKIEYYQYNKDEVLTCPVCDWQGSSNEAMIETGDANLCVICPNCEKMLLIASYPLA